MANHAYQPTPTIHEPVNWRTKAACQGENTEWWFAPKGTIKLERAKAICAECPVRAKCLEDALTVPEWEDWGLLGGVEEGPRRKMRRSVRDLSA